VATVYLRSTDGSDADDGSTWALAKALMSASLTAAGAGGTVYQSQADSEAVAGAITLTSPGTVGSPTRVICVNDGAAPPTAVATTGLVATTGNNSISFAGYALVYGVMFRAGNSTGTASLNWVSFSAWAWSYESCAFALGSSGTSSRMAFGITSGSPNNAGLSFRNCAFTFSSTSQGITAGCNATFAGGSIAATGSVPTILFLANAGFEAFEITLRGVDLSAFGSGKTLARINSGLADVFRFNDCKLGASVTITNGTPSGPNGARITLVNCDSADTNYRFYYQDYFGIITHEATIVRTGGASDGVTGFSRKFVSSANTTFQRPLYGPWFKFWDSTLSSTTVAVETVTDNVTLTDAEAWVEVLHPGTSGFPLGIFTDDRAADILATPANQTSSSETWTTTGLTTPVKQTLSKAVTPAEIGWIYARVVLAKASTTLYACPKILSTSTYQYMEEDGSIINGPTVSAGGGLIGGGNLSGGFL